MDWEALREKTLGEVGTALAAEGIGVAGGFLGAGFVGRLVQGYVKKDEDVATLTDGVMAWAGNNVPKLAIWYLLRKYTSVEPGETITPIKEMTLDIKKSMAGSVVFDTIIRMANGGKNPASVNIGGVQVLGSSPEVPKTAQADVQRLIQENSALRTELNKALQRLAIPASPPQIQPAAPAPVQHVVQAPAPVQQYVAPAPAQVQQYVAPAQVRAAPAPVQQYVAPAPAPVPVHVQVQPAPIVQTQPIAPPVVRYQPVAAPVVPYSAPVRAAPAPIRRAEMAPPAPPVVKVEQVPPAISERERRFAFMPTHNAPPEVIARERKYGFAGLKGEKDIAAMFGML